MDAADRASVDAIRTFWFGADPRRVDDAQVARWFSRDAAFDAELRERFGALHGQAVAGRLAHWTHTAHGALAWLLLVDQVSRNLFRGDARAFAGDAAARAVARACLARGDDRRLHPLERMFVYLPLEHSEALDDQHDCVRLMQALADEQADGDERTRQRFAMFVDYARRHRDVIARFGRFPHRNAVLGRTSTAAEQAYLAEPGSGF